MAQVLKMAAAMVQAMVQAMVHVISTVMMMVDGRAGNCRSCDKSNGSEVDVLRFRLSFIEGRKLVSLMAVFM